MSRTYYNRARYIDNLSIVLEARDDFKQLDYHKHTNGEEFLFMHLLTGDVAYLDITGRTDAEIFHVLAQIECGITPPELIKDNKRRLEIGKLFN